MIIPEEKEALYQEFMERSNCAQTLGHQTREALRPAREYLDGYKGYGDPTDLMYAWPNMVSLIKKAAQTKYVRKISVEKKVLANEYGKKLIELYDEYYKKMEAMK